jgi:hypothetical protein
MFHAHMDKVVGETIQKSTCRGASTQNACICSSEGRFDVSSSVGRQLVHVDKDIHCINILACSATPVAGESAIGMLNG